MASDHSHPVVQEANNYAPNPACLKKMTVSCTWINIFAVNTVEQTFQADLVVRLRWTEKATDRVLGHFTELKADDGKQYNVTKKDFIDNCWDPQLTFGNCRDFSKAEEWVRLDREGENVGVFWTVRFHAATFACVFNLRTFPFDQQSLVVRVSSTWDEKTVQFRKHPTDPVRQSYGDYNLSDYELASGRIVDVESDDPRDSGYATRSSASGSTTGSRYNSAFLIQKVSRNPAFYLINLYLPTFLICTSAFAAFAFIVDQFDGRSNILVTLLLTVVAFKQVIGNSLPRLPYLTYLDRYVLVGLWLVVSVGIIQSALAAAAVCVDTPHRKPTLCGDKLLGTLDHTYVDQGDFWSLVVAAIIWAVYHCWELFMILRARQDDAPGIRRDVSVKPKGPGEHELTSMKSEAKEEKKAV